MTIPVTSSNNVKIYNITGSANHQLPHWIVKKHSKKLKKDAEFARRVQLIQDFDFPEASLRLALTGDQQHIVATGVYKPQFRVFDLSEKSLKFERHTTCDNVAIQLLEDDWKKLVLLQSDRYIEFHSPNGLYHSARIPKMGRDMIYDQFCGELLMAASSPELYRLNLDRGQFMAPFQTEATAVNCVRSAPLHGLYGVACEGNGLVEFWDRRVQSRLGGLSITQNMKTDTDVCSSDCDVTSINFASDGVHWYAGTSEGKLFCFDLRRLCEPVLLRDHYNGYAIKKIELIENPSGGSPLVVSADRRSIRLWSTNMQSGGVCEENKNTLSLFTTIESERDINDFVVQKGSGLILAANEGSPISSYFIPSLGPAPWWCSFLENLTEEMEETSGNGGANGMAAVYGNYKFVTKAELTQLGLDHLVGTNVLRPYMHGFFIDLRLYEKAKAIANPFAYEEYVQKKRMEKLEAARQTRISSGRSIASAAKVNAKLVAKLAADVDEEVDDHSDAETGEASKERKKREKKKAISANLLADDRFTGLFQDPDFEIDEASQEYRMAHPSTLKSRRK